MSTRSVSNHGIRRRHIWRSAVFILLFFWPATAVLAGAPPNARIGRTTLAVEKLTCGACLRVIDAELRKVPGVLGMAADLAAGQVAVDHALAVTPAEVAAMITSCGYPARVLEIRTLPRTASRLFRRGPGFGTGPGCCNPGGVNPVADSWRELRRRFMRR
jgi:copper chaperone CopZ